MFREPDRELLRATAARVVALQLDFRDYQRRLDRIEALLRHEAAQEERIMATLDDTLAEAQRATSVGASAVALIGTLKTQLDGVLAGNLTPEQQAKVDAIFGAVKGNDDAVEAAVLAGTPQAPPPATP